MRKIILTILFIIGIMALVVPGSVFAANSNANFDQMQFGKDYTYTWTTQGYDSWLEQPSTSADMWGGWYWAAQFVTPCPQWLKTPNYEDGKCNWDSTVNTDYSMSADPQTKWGLDSELDGTIVDDLYARVLDNWLGSASDTGTGYWKGILDQDLDILFGRHNNVSTDEKHVIYDGTDAHTTDTYIDQAIDQQFAYWEDLDSNNAVNPNTENGITQRLINDFAIALFSTYNSPTDSVVIDKVHLQKEHGIDQWVVQWLRDIETGGRTGADHGGVGKEGIDQLYSSWFADDIDAINIKCDDGTSGIKCGHTYKLNHPEIVKETQKNMVHDHNPNDGTTYQSKGTGLVWDP